MAKKQQPQQNQRQPAVETKEPIMSESVTESIVTDEVEVSTTVTVEAQPQVTEKPVYRVQFEKPVEKAVAPKAPTIVEMTEQQKRIAAYKAHFEKFPVKTPAIRSELIELFKKVMVYTIENPTTENLSDLYMFLEKNQGAMLATEIVFGTGDNFNPGVRMRMSTLYTAIVMTIQYKAKTSKMKPNLETVREVLKKDDIVTFLAVKID